MRTNLNTDNSVSGQFFIDDPDVTRDIDATIAYITTTKSMII